MSDDNKVSVGLMILILGLVLGGMSISSYYDNLQDEAIVSAIKAGATPLEAVCALDGGYGERTVCIIAAVKQEK